MTIDRKWKKIGISLSGGADSALLAYLICLNSDAEIHVVTQVRNWKTRPWQRHISLEVFNWLVSKFPKNKFVRHEGFIPPELEEPISPLIKDEYGEDKPGNRIILRAHNEFIIHNYQLDAWFSAVTKNPSINISGALPERNEGVLPLHMKHMGIDVYHPFVHTSKDWIIKQYYENNILDLLELTRSCEGDNSTRPEVFLDLDYRTYKPGQQVPICGRCFWCKERAWAFEQVK